MNKNINKKSNNSNWYDTICGCFGIFWTLVCLSAMGYGITTSIKESVKARKAKKAQTETSQKNQNVSIDTISFNTALKSLSEKTR